MCLRASRRRCGVDTGAVLPVGILDPLQLGLVVAVKGLGDELVGEQVKMNISGHSRRAPLRRRIAFAGNTLAKFPSAIKREAALLRRAARDADDDSDQECGECRKQGLGSMRRKHGCSNVLQLLDWLVQAPC